MTATHSLSEDFLKDLHEGCLQPVLKAVQDDDTLMLGLRGSYISIYYRGGELIKIEENRNRTYLATFNVEYDKNAAVLPERLTRYRPIDIAAHSISTADCSTILCDVFHELKWLMDRHTKVRSGHEREFQQLVARENNRARSAGSTDYFITDMEHAHARARFDMIGARWLHNERKRGDLLVPTLFEMKYGENALTGKAGLEAHLGDIVSRLECREFRDGLRANVEVQFNQLHKLELLHFTKSSSFDKFTSEKDTFQIVFLLAGHNPRSTTLLHTLMKMKEVWVRSGEQLRTQGITVDLLFFRTSFCGYSMHAATMHSIDQVIESLSNN